MKLQVEEFSSNDEELIRFLDDLGSKNPSILGYHYPFYRDMLVAIGVGQPVYLGARLDGKLAGYLPAFSRQSEEGAVFSSLPFFGPNGGVLCREGEWSGEIHSALLRALVDRAKENGALSCSIYTPFLFQEFNLYDDVMPDAIIVNKFTQYLNMLTTDWNQGALARNLRKAEREGVRITKEITPELFETFYTLYESNCLEFGIPLKPKKCAEFLTSEGVIGKYTEIYFAIYDGEMIGGLLIIRSAQTVSYYIPCSLTSARTLQPGVLLIAYAMREAVARGLRYWNWESSPSRDSGVYRFKEKWSSVEAPYRIYVRPFAPPEKFLELGKGGIAKLFPYYFTYPFDLL